MVQISILKEASPLVIKFKPLPPVLLLHAFMKLSHFYPVANQRGCTNTIREHIPQLGAGIISINVCKNAVTMERIFPA